MQEFDFGHRRGSFEQDAGTLGGFVGWFSGDVWGTAQASWTKNSYDVERRVQLGPAERIYRGSPDGDNFTFGANAGWDFRRDALTHGPVVGVVWQKIEVDGFSEDRVDAAGLAFPDQDIDSLVGSAGWQASYALSDKATPYARVSWEHEFEDAPEEAFAQSLTIPGTLPYAVPGLERDDSYGTLLLGLRTDVWGVQTDVGAVASVGQEGGDYATLFVTFGRSF